MRFSGKVSKDGTVLLPVVAGDLDFATGGSISWTGSFPLAPGEFLGVGEYTLELNDGRSGTINVLHVRNVMNRPTVVHFEVSGQLQ